MLLESSSKWVFSLEGLVENILENGKVIPKYRTEISRNDCPLCGQFDCQHPHETINVDSFLMNPQGLTELNSVSQESYRVLEHGFHNHRGENG